MKPIGQIIFDVNGEYANDNQQDQGTAIYQLYGERRDTIQHPPEARLQGDEAELLPRDPRRLRDDALEPPGRKAIYTQAFLNVNWEAPDPLDNSATTRHGRRLACYQAILREAGFTVPAAHRVELRRGEADQ